jgi:hypothetical protein
MILLAGTCPAFAQKPTGALRGQVTDEFGGAIVWATVTLTDERGAKAYALTNDEGAYTFTALKPGKYTVRAVAKGFAPYDSTVIDIGQERQSLNLVLKPAMEAQQVTVPIESSGVSVEPESNGDSIILRESEIDQLPDDPDDLVAALQALAGPAAGPDGAEIIIDGFRATRLPPKNNIREIRINQNPFSAENDRLGSRGIEIFTKPGTDILRGLASFNFSDESLNSRNPFAANRAPFQLRQYAFNLSGPIVAQKASYFIDFDRREIADNAVVNALILDPALNITSFSRAVVTPEKRTTASARFDYQVNAANTLVFRYSFARTGLQNVGVGGLSLPTRASNVTSEEQTVQLTETHIVNKRVVNETHFEFTRLRNDQRGDGSVPALQVLDAFIGGGAQVGHSFDRQNRWEVQNVTAWQFRRHFLKFGLRLRGVTLNDIAQQNFSGTYIFTGGPAPQLDANNEVVLGSDGQPVLTQITSIERYRRSLFFQRRGLTAQAVRDLGGGASQFLITRGNPEASVNRIDLGAFVQNDWRIRPNFTLSLGLRYDTQNGLNRHLNLAPRIRFAWSPDGSSLARRPRTVIRGGFGIFYERVGENLFLQTERFDGTREQQFVVTDPPVVVFSTTPPPNVLSGFELEPTRWQFAQHLRMPYTMQMALGMDRQLPHNTVLSVTYLGQRTLHALRARNVNAPVLMSGELIFPLGDIGNVFQYESSAVFNQHLLLVLLNSQFNRRFSFFTRYILGTAKSNADGPGTFPANSYDLSTEYGRAANDIRHRFLFAGSYRTWRDIMLTPFIVVASGRPFNITTGRDINGDSLFTDRPAFATDLSKPGVITTPFGSFDPNPPAGAPLIPRNFGNGPGFVTLNLRASRTWNFGGRRIASSQPGRAGNGAGDFRNSLTLSLQIVNLFNHNNAALPVGNLSSPLFGRSINSAAGFTQDESVNPSAGNRRIQAQLTFTF